MLTRSAISIRKAGTGKRWVDPSRPRTRPAEWEGLKVRQLKEKILGTRGEKMTWYLVGFKILNSAHVGFYGDVWKDKILSVELVTTYSNSSHTSHLKNIRMSHDSSRMGHSEY